MICWCASVLVLLGLHFGLDRYRRLPLAYGYGPDRREFFETTLARASELEEKGLYPISGEERWDLVGDWLPAEGERAKTAQRRAVIVVPVLTPRALELELELLVLPEAGAPAAGATVEYGVNGAVLDQVWLPPEGASIRVDVPAARLFRGDNTVYFYRESRRSDPGPWLSLGNGRVRVSSDLPQ